MSKVIRVHFMFKKLAIYTCFAASLFASEPEAKKRKIQDTTLRVVDQEKLVVAIKDNDTEKVIEILDDLPLNELDQVLSNYSEIFEIADQSIALEACKYGSKKLIISLMKHARILADIFDNEHNSLLHVACKHNRYDLVVFLLQEYPDLVTVMQNENETFLHTACQHGTKKLIVLIEPFCQAILHQTNILGQSAFDVACIHDKREIVEYFLDKYPELAQARAEQIKTIAFCDKQTRNYNNHIIKLLIKYGIDIQPEIERNSFIVNRFGCFSDLGRHLALMQTFKPAVEKAIASKSCAQIRTYQKLQKKVLTLVFGAHQLHSIFTHMIDEYQNNSEDNSEELENIFQFLKALSIETNICLIKDREGNTLLHTILKKCTNLDCEDIIKCLLSLNVRILTEPNNEGIHCFLEIITSRQYELQNISPIVLQLQNITGVILEQQLTPTQSL